MQAFIVRESGTLKEWMIGLREDFHTNYPKFWCRKSYHILEARLLGLSYPDYLKYCVMNGATLSGRLGFPHAVFKNKRDAERVCNLVNSEWEKFQVMIMKGE